MIREKRCFVCRIFEHMAHYCRNREEKKRLVWVLQNRFEILKNRVIQKGEESSRKIVKDRREILKEKREKKTKVEKEIQKKTKVQKKDLENKKKKKTNDEK